jgi:stage II sporulation protein D
VPVRRRIRAGGIAAVLVASLSSLAVADQVHAACPPAAGVPIAHAPDPVPRAPIVFRGHGWGHGLGMSQYGAQGAARLGCSYRRILRTYYTGTRVTASSMPATVSVRMTENARVAWITLVSGAVVWRNGNHTVYVQRSGGLRVRWISATSIALLHGRRRVWAGPVAAAGLRAVHRAGVVRLDSPTDPYGKLPMSLRWDAISFRVDGAGMDVVKVFGNNRHGPAMDKYLLGLAEIPASWPRAALRAQAVAARTFAVKRAGALLPTVAHQNYNGYGYEASDLAQGSRWRAAVWATSGQIVVDGSNRAIDAFYSSSMGGWTEDKVYSWGGAPVSYLRPVNDSRWDRASDNPATLRSWTRGFTRRQVARALGFGRVTSVFVFRRGDPRRAAGVRVIGRRGGQAVTVWLDGFDVRNALGLLSPGFVVKNNP